MRREASSLLVVLAGLTLWGWGHALYWAGRADARHEAVVVARCPAWDRLVILPTPWEAEHGRRVRHIPNPCPEYAR